MSYQGSSPRGLIGRVENGLLVVLHQAANFGMPKLALTLGRFRSSLACVI
jgi:hypothetical protein